MAMHRSLLIKELKKAFPDITGDLNAEEGLLTFEVEVFSRYAQKCIDRVDRLQVEACFEIARRYYVDGNPKMKDAIDVCFVEPLDFKNSKKTKRSWAWDLFPAVLKELHTQFHSQFRT